MQVTKNFSIGQNEVHKVQRTNVIYFLAHSVSFFPSNWHFFTLNFKGVIFKSSIFLNWYF